MLELLILGAIAVFLISRLFQVLGQKTGFENPDVALHMSQRLASEAVPLEEDPAPDLPDKVLDGKLEASIQKIKAMDPSFRTDFFLQGATRAFEILIEAFSKGDSQTLQKLMSAEVYATFEKAIMLRQEKNQRLATTLVKLDPPTISKIKLTEAKVGITVRFVSEQINILYADDGSILEGSPKQMEEVIDQWTFERELISPNPNWCLIEIKS